jgi:hypothetical protein
MTESSNPLKRFFRQPAVFLRLPSAGNYYPSGAIEIPPTKEVPVYPMTALDEITYRTADALFNGSAVAEVIRSCVPSIIDPWAVPAIDIDSLLIAIKIASTGNSMDFESSCPECKEENDFSLDLNTVLGSINTPDYSQTLTIGDLVIYFKPLTYQQINDNALSQYEDQRLLSSIPDSDLPDSEKVKQLNDAFLKLTKLTMSAISLSISMIVADDTMVSDVAYINEFIKEADGNTFNAIRDHIVKLRAEAELKPLKLQCRSCGHKYESVFTLNPSNFFGRAS